MEWNWRGWETPSPKNTQGMLDTDERRQPRNSEYEEIRSLALGKHGNMNEWDTRVKDQNQKYVQQTLGLVAVVFGAP